MPKAFLLRLSARGGAEQEREELEPEPARDESLARVRRQTRDPVEGAGVGELDVVTRRARSAEEHAQAAVVGRLEGLGRESDVGEVARESRAHALGGDGAACVVEDPGAPIRDAAAERGARVEDAVDDRDMARDRV